MAHSSVTMAFEEATDTAVNEIVQLADVIPENNYWGFTAYSVIISHILTELGRNALPTRNLSHPLWNYLDSVCSAILGASQLMDKGTHRPVATRLKGIANLANSIQMLTLTALSPLYLGPISLTASFGLGFVLSLDDTFRAIRRARDPQYWLDDTLGQIQSINAAIHQLDKDVTELYHIADVHDGYLVKWAIQHKVKRLNWLFLKKTELCEDVLARVKQMRYNDENIFTRDSTVFDAIEQYLNNHYVFDYEFKKKLVQICNCDHDVIKKECETKAHKDHLKIIRQKCKKDIRVKTRDSLIWGLAFVGMVLLCIPGLQFAGFACMSVASILYFKKNLPGLIKATKKIGRTVHDFFSSKGTPPLDVEIELESEFVARQCINR